MEEIESVQDAFAVGGSVVLPGEKGESGLELLAYLSEARIPAVRGHGRRVAAMASCLASLMGLPEDQITTLRRAALLHDIGKASLPVDILTRPAADLSERERRQYERHAQTGAAMVRTFLGDPRAADIVGAHHEAFDGSGFPDKRKGADLSLSIRILAVCDSLDRALVNDLSAARRTITDAVELLKRQAGRTLDPEVMQRVVESSSEWIEVAIRDLILVPLELLRPDMLLAADIINLAGVRSLRAGTKVYQKLIDKLQKDVLIDPVATPIAVLFDSLPYCDATMRARPTQERVTPQASATPASATQPPLVVVVDDEASVVSALNRELRSAGYRVKSFTLSVEALFYIRNERGERGDDEVFALITDYNMPGLRGDNFLYHVQQEFPELPCIVLTGLATKDTIVSIARSARILKIIPKPWDKMLLLNVLAGIQQ